MLSKVTFLLENQEFICKVPGEKPGMFIVHSKRDPKKPHYVDATFKCGKVTCNCLNNASFRLCAYAIAVSRIAGKEQAYSNWHNKNFKLASHDALSAHSIPRSVGKNS